MNSPFPGMDPYVEDASLWHDFHAKLISEIERKLAALVPDRYFVQTGERSYIVLAGADGKEQRPIYPDVEISAEQREPEPGNGAVAVASPETATATDAVTMRAFIDEHFRENFVEIYEGGADVRLVTCIEVLSPTNKRRGSEGWDQYLRKRNALLLGQANLVEIDLLRGGPRMPMVEAWPKSPYYLLVGRQSRVPYCRVWPAHYRQPLPEIPVPLASPDPDIPLGLQPLIAAVYERSRYRRRLDYAKPLSPPLPAEDSAWLAERVRAAN